MTIGGVVYKLNEQFLVEHATDERGYKDTQGHGYTRREHDCVMPKVLVCQI